MHYCTLEWSLPDFLRSITVHIVFHLQLGAPKLVFAPGVLSIQEFVHRFGSGLLMVWSVVVGRKLVENGSKSQASKSPSSIPDQFSLLSRVSFNWINKEPSTMCSWWKWLISVAACEESIVLRVGFSRSIDSTFSETKISGDDYEHCVSSVPKALIGYRRGPAANANDHWVSARM